MSSSYCYKKCVLRDDEPTTEWETINIAARGQNVEDEEGKQVAERYKDGKWENQVVAMRMGKEGDEGFNITCVMIKGEPRKSGANIPSRNIAAGEWCAKVDLFTVWADTDGVYVCNEEAKDVLLSMQALIVPPTDDGRPPVEFLPVTVRSTVSHASGSLKVTNYVIDADTHDNVVLWAKYVSKS